MKIIIKYQSKINSTKYKKQFFLHLINHNNNDTKAKRQQRLSEIKKFA